MKYLIAFNESKDNEIKTFIEEVLINIIDRGAKIYTKTATNSTNVDIRFGKKTKWDDVKNDIIKFLELIRDWGIDFIYIHFWANTIVINNKYEIDDLINEKRSISTYFTSIEVHVHNPKHI